MYQYLRLIEFKIMTQTESKRDLGILKDSYEGLG